MSTTKASATSLDKRVAVSPREFAALFGRHQSWAYRLLYANKIKAVTTFGKLLIPVAEADKIVASATSYDPKKKPAKASAEVPA